MPFFQFTEFCYTHTALKVVALRRLRWKDTSEVILSQANQERSNTQIYDVFPALHSSRPKISLA